MPAKALILLCVLVSTEVPPVSGTGWPVYRHDVALSGVSSAQGRIQTPRIMVEHYLGAPFLPAAMTCDGKSSNAADLDGDGKLEKYTISGTTIDVTDIAGQRLWSFTVSGLPLGGNVRVAKLLPGRKGQQIISFSSRMDTGEGQGYCFVFDKGVQQGELAWTTGPLTGQYSPMLIVDDVDGDRMPEVVTAPHYCVQIFSGQTGELKAEIPVAKGRNYGILVSRRRGDRPQKDIYIVCDFVLHVECVRFEKGR